MPEGALQPAPLHRALSPRKIAVFGASAAPGKQGYVVVAELIRQGFSGELALVNPRGGTAFGRPLLDASSAAGADIAVITTPAHVVPEIVTQCGELGIPVVVVQSAGFAETGNNGLEQELRTRALDAGVRIIGPNCLGLFTSSVSANLTALPDLPSGSVSFISQSGGLAFHVSRHLRSLGSGFDLMLSLGNKIDLGFVEAIEAAATRDSTESLLLYLESLDEGENFLDEISKISQDLPVIALVGGQSTAGRAAAASHTGSMLSQWDRVAGMLADAGASVFESLETATTLAAQSRRSRRTDINRVFVLCDGGGHSVLLADALSREGFHLAAPSSKLQGALDSLLGGRRSGQNPIDLAGLADADPTIYASITESVLGSGEYDAIVVGGFFGGYAYLFGDQLGGMETKTASDVVGIARRYGRPLVVQSVFANEDRAAVSELRRLGIPLLEWPEETARYLRSRSSGRVAPAPSPAASAARDPELAQLTETTVAALDAAGIRHAIGKRMAEDELPTDSNERWVLRLDGVAHKQRIGAIKVGIASPDLVDAYGELVGIAESHGIEPLIRLAPYIPHEHELIVTFWRNEQEGLGWLLGAGGEAVEREADTAVGRLPQLERDVMRMISRTQVGRRLELQSPPSLTSFSSIVLQLSHLFRGVLSDLVELECNPIAIAPDGAVVLDILPAAGGTGVGRPKA